MNKIITLAFLIYSGLYANSFENLDDIQKKYVSNYIESINSNDMQALKKMSHKSYLSCINSKNSDYYDSLYEKALSRNISNNYKVTIEILDDESIEKEFAGAKKMGIPYPIKPTHKLQIDYQRGEYSFVTIVRNLVLENSNYYEVSGCPSPEMIAKFREIRIKKEKHRIRAKELFSQLKEPLLSDLTKLLNEGQKIKAWRKYSEETGESLSMAKEVLSNIKVK